MHDDRVERSERRDRPRRHDALPGHQTPGPQVGRCACCAMVSWCSSATGAAGRSRATGSPWTGAARASRLRRRARRRAAHHDPELCADTRSSPTTVTLPLVVALVARRRLHALAQRLSSCLAPPAQVWFSVTKTAAADYTPAPGKPVFILVIGNDGRPGETSTRGDAIHLIGGEPGRCARRRSSTSHATPGCRFPGHGSDKVNASHVVRRRGTPGRDARQRGRGPGAVRDRREFGGFIGMVDDMGGLQVNVPEAMERPRTPVRNFRPGRRSMSGAHGAGVRPQPPPVPDRRPQAAPRTRATSSPGTGPAPGARTPGPVGTLKLLANLGRHTQLVGHRPRRPLRRSAGWACRSIRRTSATSSCRSAPGSGTRLSTSVRRCRSRCSPTLPTTGSSRATSSPA